ncbi:ApaG protein [Teredinibacter turnerae T7901]|uniref:Protein ApaG n=1 Tax=Teredinibacter turnerae (strain ATCC 39867 / T7901) TaxID=377629 RepID=C5BPB9_TERTT|nr:Co2+/Mg2+ efflux protein ApaG [Teredinibacter turnerae]ACR10777.1 ApaG protein [Teredinibacter turnerae T7901]
MSNDFNVGVSNTVQISVATRYIEEQSLPEQHKYVYSYTVSIFNQGIEDVQLLSRYWHITDANDKVQEVQGVGVVGEQPTIAPGEDYTYTSGTVMATPTGLMKGYYTMKSASGLQFDAEIPVFALVQPHALH